MQQGLGAGYEGGQIREGASRVRPLGHTVIDREADPALQADGQASVVHCGLPGDRPKGGNAHLGRGHERLEEVDAELFADAVERLEVNVGEHGELRDGGGLRHPAADDSTDGPAPLREGVGPTRVDPPSAP
jgi:hypothetical protein